MNDISEKCKWALMFTGHMIDLPGRTTPRFPADLEDKARDAIHDVLEDTIDQFGKDLVAVASCARGGDILFVEACQAQGIEVNIVLPTQPDLFVKKSVDGAKAGNWEQRFWDIWYWTKDQNKEIILSDGTQNIFEKCNDRIIEIAQEKSDDIHLLVLWEGEQPTLLGGPSDFVKKIEAMNQPVHQILLSDL